MRLYRIKSLKNYFSDLNIWVKLLSFLKGLYFVIRIGNNKIIKTEE